jgi:beta-lactamase superfamily II metal-dependent hydrolase
MPGNLDIHHVDTGRGNATFVMGPEGTTLLVDCGVSNTSLSETSPSRPNGSRSPGQWVARYALRHARTARRSEFDYLVATHIHPDHIGDIPTGARKGGHGYVPTGLSEVDDLMPAVKVIDRAFPDFGSMPPLDAPFASNYLAWLRSRVARGLAVEAARAGSTSQITWRKAAGLPRLEARVVATSGRVWTGSGEDSALVIRDPAGLSRAELPSENQLSIALRIDYGRFSYYTGGDLNFDTHDGRMPWNDVETPVARATGRVEVATANHHGYFDAVGPEFVRSLDAQAYIIQSWHLSHPGPAQLERMLGAWPGQKPRDVFALEMLPVNRAFNSRFVGKLRSTQGHVVVRVAPDGESYRIYVLNSLNEHDEIVGEFGPYRCRA